MYQKVEKRGNRKYHYLIENIRLNDKWKKIKIYLGSDLSEKEIKDLISEKKELLEEKARIFRESQDPLLTLIKDRDLKALEKIRKGYSEFKITRDSFSEREYYDWFVTEFTYNTNAIEGSTLTLLDTKLILHDKIAPKDKYIKEVYEVQNHRDAFEYMISYKGSLTKGFVLKMHKKLMHNILWKYAGVFRDVSVRIVGVDKSLPKPSQVPIEFKKLMKWYASNKKKYHPVIIASYFHAAFESIHPFRDGNGRIGRLILNYMLKDSGFPMIDIKYIDRRKYYESLQEADNGNLKPMLDLVIKYIYDSWRKIKE